MTDHTNSQGPAPIIIVAARAPYQATKNGHIVWRRRTGGLATGASGLPRGSVFIATPRDAVDQEAHHAGLQPQDLVARGHQQRFLSAANHEFSEHREYFGRITRMLHHDLLDDFAPQRGNVDGHVIDPHIPVDTVARLHEAHVRMNRIAAWAVVDEVNRICDETGRLPIEIPVLVQDHQFDLVPSTIVNEWSNEDNPRRSEAPPPAVLFIHTAIASRASWERFVNMVPKIAMFQAKRLAATQVSMHDTTWAAQWVENLRVVLGAEAQIPEPWPSVYPPNPDRIRDIKGTEIYANDLAAVRATARGRRVIAVVSRLHPAKNLPGAVHGFAALLERRPDLRENTVLMLQTSERSEYPEYAADEAALQSVIDNVNAPFVEAGRMPPVDWVKQRSGFRAVALEEAADVVLLPSLKDGFGHAALEGYLAGSTAVLVTSPNTGAARWVAEHAGPDAMITIDPQHPSDIAAGLEAALALEPTQRVARAALLGRAANELVARGPRWVDEQVRWAQAKPFVETLAANAWRLQYDVGR